MARAKRHYIPGYAWHITHRCHKKEFLLKFPRDRRRWIEWLFRSKKRYGLSVLNYMVTSNHVRLLVFDNKRKNIIPDSMRLTAGRTAQEYNIRKKRKGAFWDDRYHATAVETNRHLLRCIVHIDPDMVRAGVAEHPSEWDFCGYNEIQKPRRRKGIIDFEVLMGLLNMENRNVLKEVHHEWVNNALSAKNHVRESHWTQSLAVGSKNFTEKVMTELGYRAKGRSVIGNDDMSQVREDLVEYGNNDDFIDNTFAWDRAGHSSAN